MFSRAWFLFVVRRLFGLTLVLIGLVTATFLMVRLVPGDPAKILGGITSTPAQVAAIRDHLGLDKPLLSQYIHYWTGLVHGDLGESYFTQGTSVGQIISQRLGSSLVLATTSLAVVLLVSVPLGLLVGIFTRDGRHTRFELGFTSITSILGAVPEFLAATLLVLLFAVKIPIFPVAGQSGWQSLVLPALALSIRPVCILARLVRVETLNALQEDYMRTAASKRLPRRLLVFRHLLPNVVTAALSIGGLLFSGLIGGAVVVEIVFARNGLGSALVSAVLQHDYAVIQGLILVLGAAVVVVNGIVDMILGLIDPRSLARDT